MDEPPDDHWEQTYARLAPKLLLYARQWLPHPEDAEDAVHDAFLRTWRRRGERLHDAYYFAATRCAAIDLGRRVARRASRELLLVERDGEAVAGMPALSAADVDDALRRLPDEQRETVVLKVWGGLPFSEIARIMNVPQNTAASRYRYAIDALRKALECTAP